MIAVTTHALDELELALRMSGKRNVPAFARYRGPLCARPDETGDADAGARAEHDFGCVRQGLTLADPMQLLAPKMRERPSERLEVVEDEDVIEFQ